MTLSAIGGPGISYGSQLPNTAASNPSSSTTNAGSAAAAGLSAIASPKLQDTLAGVLADKATVRHLLEARGKLLDLPAHAGTPGAIFQALGELGVIGHIDLKAEQVMSLFVDGQHALLARTLTKGEKATQGLSGDSAPATYTPAKIERNTMNNRLRELNIQLTPSTLIDSELNVSTISSHPDRPKWSGMPSVIYAIPFNQGTDLLGKLDTFKKSFGNTLSFASNNGFTADFLEKVNSGQYSHAELLDEFRNQPAIQNNLKAGPPFDQLPQSLVDIKQQASQFHSLQQQLQENQLQSQLYPDGSSPHNEVINRLHLWDATAVEAGKDLLQGLSTAIELQIARRALATELEAQGTQHPLFTDYLLQQLSVGDHNTVRDRAATEARHAQLSEADKTEILAGLREKLLAPVSLCRYTPAEATMSGIEETELTGADVLGALDEVLKARLGPDGFDAIVASMPTAQP